MTRLAWIHFSLAIIIALAALFIVRMHDAGGATLAADSAGVVQPSSDMDSIWKPSPASGID